MKTFRMLERVVWDRGRGIFILYLIFFQYLLSIWYDTDRMENAASNNSIIAWVSIAAAKCLRSLENNKGNKQTHRQ
jgi:hypothetical protein